MNSKKRNHFVLSSYLLFSALVLATGFIAVKYFYLMNPVSTELPNTLVASYCDNSWSKFSEKLPESERYRVKECLTVYANSVSLTIDDLVVNQSENADLVRQAHQIVERAQTIFTTDEAMTNLASWDQLPITGSIPQELRLYTVGTQTTVITEPEYLSLIVNEMPDELNAQLIEIIDEIKLLVNSSL